MLVNPAATYYWIGLTDETKEGEFVWQNSLEKLGKWTNWIPGEPNQLGNEDCVEMKSFRGWQWNDGKCDIQRGFICEFK